MKIKIESAWKSLCDAFPKLKDNPLYKGWYISYAILVTLSILTVVVVNHRIVYSFPFDWFGLLFGIILPWVLTTFYIVYQGVDHAHQFTSTKVVLGLFMLPVILIGFTSSYKNEYSYSNRMVTTVFDQELTQQSFHATKITSNQLDYFKEDNVIFPYKKNTASEIYAVSYTHLSLIGWNLKLLGPIPKNQVQIKENVTLSMTIFVSREI